MFNANSLYQFAYANFFKEYIKRKRSERNISFLTFSFWCLFRFAIITYSIFNFSLIPMIRVSLAKTQPFHLGCGRYDHLAAERYYL
jgi:hypothetical protein